MNPDTSKSRFYDNRRWKIAITAAIGSVPIIAFLITFGLFIFNYGTVFDKGPCEEFFRWSYDCKWRNFQTMVIELIIAGSLAAALAYYFFTKEQMNNEPMKENVEKFEITAKSLVGGIDKLDLTVKDLVKMTDEENQIRRKRLEVNRLRIGETIQEINSLSVEFLFLSEDWNCQSSMENKHNLIDNFNRIQSRLMRISLNPLNLEKVTMSDDFSLIEIEEFQKISGYCQSIPRFWRDIERKSNTKSIEDLIGSCKFLDEFFYLDLQIPKKE